ncbi:hypothetical protein Tco_0266306 [Tanacetum coccineum]
MAWTTIDTRLRPSVSSTPDDLNMDDDLVPDEQVHSSDDEDIRNDHIPKVNLKHDWWKPLSEEDKPATPEPTGDMETFMDWYYKKQGITELTQKDLEGPAFEIVKVFHPDVIHLQYQMEECHKLLTDRVDDAIIRYNDQQTTTDPKCIGSLEQMVPDQMWIEEECKYDIAAMYGISHWWFQRQRFYIDRHTSEGDRRAIRTHMRILSVVQIEIFSLYGYDYMKKIVLRRADLQEYIIAERDFKYLYLSDFEDLYFIETFRDATDLEFKHDFTINDSPRAITFRDKYRVQMIMRLNEIHKFSDHTLQQIDEALDYWVKEFKVNKESGLDTRFWTRKDVERSKEFMFAI